MLFFELRVICSFEYTCDTCGLTEIPTGIPSDAKKMYLTNNQISNIPTAAFKGFRFLEILDVSNNDITDIDDGVFSDMSRCEMLWLNNNQLTYIK